MFFLKKDMVEISKELRVLRNQEPTSTPQKDIMRAAIMGYELGAIQQYTIRNAAKDYPEILKKGYEANAKLGMADLIIQCRMFCLDHYWNFDEIQKLGMTHLKERHEDFKREGWGGV
jgi:hypothetical protein